ncbi:unnamed protein product, partial [Mesorhabditis belari]|uniref:RGS domain-containing protein n=1 Tax=Mesorhabditis belari TaxID=2138241 RepID=A0AAF3F3L1_9BILA
MDKTLVSVLKKAHDPSMIDYIAQNLNYMGLNQFFSFHKAIGAEFYVQQLLDIADEYKDHTLYKAIKERLMGPLEKKAGDFFYKIACHIRNSREKNFEPYHQYSFDYNATKKATLVAKIMCRTMDSSYCEECRAYKKWVGKHATEMSGSFVRYNYDGCTYEANSTISGPGFVRCFFLKVTLPIGISKKIGEKDLDILMMTADMLETGESFRNFNLEEMFQIMQQQQKLKELAEEIDEKARSLMLSEQQGSATAAPKQRKPRHRTPEGQIEFESETPIIRCRSGMIPSSFFMPTTASFTKFLHHRYPNELNVVLNEQWDSERTTKVWEYIKQVMFDQIRYFTNELRGLEGAEYDQMIQRLWMDLSEHGRTCVETFLIVCEQQKAEKNLLPRRDLRKIFIESGLLTKSEWRKVDTDLLEDFEYALIKMFIGDMSSLDDLSIPLYNMVQSGRGRRHVTDQPETSSGVTSQRRYSSIYDNHRDSDASSTSSRHEENDHSPCWCPHCPSDQRRKGSALAKAINKRKTRRN